MTKEITKANIIQEIQNKFQLREFTPAQFLFDETVVPTYDMGQHVKAWDMSRGRVAVSANGTLIPYAVPETEQWRIRRLSLINETGGNFDVDQIFTYHPSVPTAITYVFYNTASPIGTGTVKIFEFPQDIPMSPGEHVMINISNYVGAGYVSVHMLKEVETIR